jgi:hypothetical protein
MKTPSQEELETMRDARTASLLRRWLSGKKLTDEEKIEVSQRASVPLEILILGPSAPGAKEAVQRATTTRKHAKYPKKLPEYAAFYGKDERTIKRLIRRGKETGELPPLDEAQRMAGWWRRNMDHEVPDWLLGFTNGAIEAANRQSGSDTAANDSIAAGIPQSGTTARDYSGVKSLDIVENVEALRYTHAINKHLLDEALHAAEPNDTLTNLRRKNFEGSFELLRKAEITLIEVQKQRGNLIDKESVKTELAQVFESLRLMRETMPRRIIIALEQLVSQSGPDPRRFQRILAKLEVLLMPAIEKARADEENIFRGLGTLEGVDSVQKLLAA